MADSYAEKHELDGLVLGAILNEVRDKGLYKQLGYATIDEFLTCERVGNLGRSQCWVWMDVARVTAPPIAAPTLKAQVLNTQGSRPLLSPDFVAKAGISRTNAVVKKWSKSTPEQRQELIDSALNSSNKDFYETAYGNGQPKVSFSVTGDSIMLWRDDIGTLVARVMSLDPQDRSELLDKLGIS